MSVGRMVFALVALHTVLNHTLADAPTLPVIWILSVPTAAITIGWLTWFFYRDLYDAEERYLTDEEIAP
jgi:hypothetical protein